MAEVIVDEDGVRRVSDDGTVLEAVRWDALREVRVMTTSQGPFVDDVFFVLDGGAYGCVVPQALAPEGFVERLQELPGFDDEQLIASMTSTSEAEFVCWRRAS